MQHNFLALANPWLLRVPSSTPRLGPPPPQPHYASQLLAIDQQVHYANLSCKQFGDISTKQSIPEKRVNHADVCSLVSSAALAGIPFLQSILQSAATSILDRLCIALMCITVDEARTTIMLLC